MLALTERTDLAARGPGDAPEIDGVVRVKNGAKLEKEWEALVKKYEKAHGKNIKRISTPAIDMLTSYHFPGNVRELENAIERASALCEGMAREMHRWNPGTRFVGLRISNIFEEPDYAAIPSF